MSLSSAAKSCQCLLVEMQISKGLALRKTDGVSKRHMTVDSVILADFCLRNEAISTEDTHERCPIFVVFTVLHH